MITPLLVSAPVDNYDLRHAQPARGTSGKRQRRTATGCDAGC